MAQAWTRPKQPAQPPGIFPLALSVRKAHERFTNLETQNENIEERLRRLESNVGKMAVGKEHERIRNLEKQIENIEQRLRTLDSCVGKMAVGILAMPELMKCVSALQNQIDSLAAGRLPDEIYSVDMRDCN